MKEAITIDMFESHLTVFHQATEQWGTSKVQCRVSGTGRGLSLPGGPESLRISPEGRFSKSQVGLAFLRLNPFLMSAKRRSTMHSSFGGGRPLFTGGREMEGRGSKPTHGPPNRKCAFLSEVHTYFPILPLLPLGFLLCQLLFPFLCLDNLLLSGFVFLYTNKMQWIHIPAVTKDLVRVVMQRNIKCFSPVQTNIVKRPDNTTKAGYTLDFWQHKLTQGTR